MTMKKLLYHSALCLGLLCCGMLTLTSCDEDIADAVDLSGEWEGNMGMYYTDDYGNTYDAHNTYIAFYPDDEYATHGYGEEIDYFLQSSGCPIYYQNFYIEWLIRDQVLYLTYLGAPELDIALYDYRFIKSRTRLLFTIHDVPYELRKLSDFYHGDWYWWDHDDNIMRHNKDYYHYMTWAQYNAKARKGNVSKETDAEGGTEAPKNYVEIHPEKFHFGRDFSKVKPAAE